MTNTNTNNKPITNKSPSNSSENLGKEFNNSNNNKDHYDLLVNVLMLGAEEVGKGSVVRRYTEGYFPINENLYNINIDCKTRDIIGWGWGNGYSGSKPITARLKIWNFHMHRIGDGPNNQHYKDSDGILLFFDVTSKTSFLQLPLLLDMVKSKYKSNDPTGSNVNAGINLHMPPIVIVGNKCDSEDIAVDQNAARKYCDSLSIPLVYISAKTNENVELAFNTLQTLIVKQTKARERERLRLLKLQQQQTKVTNRNSIAGKKPRAGPEKDVPCSIM